MMWLNPNKLPFYDPLIDNKVAVITGGTRGIGYYTSLHLYMHGFKVYLCGINSHLVQKVIQTIRDEAELRREMSEKTPRKDTNSNINCNSSSDCDQSDDDVLADAKFGELFYIHLDLRDLKCVERAAIKIQKLEKHIDILINNAGINAIPCEFTKDGFEIQLQTNYISHFLFTLRLLRLIKNCNGRIISLASWVHHLQFKYWNLNKNFNYTPSFVFTWFRYAKSKTCLIQFSKMLSIKYPTVLCVTIHPGLVMNTNLFSNWTRLPIFGIFFWVLFQIIGCFFGITSEQGALGTLKCALSPELTVENDNGKYYTTGGIESRSSSVANNIDDAASTWIWTMHELKKRGIEI